MNFTDIWKICPEPQSGAVIVGDTWRITVLTDRLIRLEYEKDGHFRNGATRTVINRQFPLVPYSVKEEHGRLVLDTESVRLEYDKKPFSSEGLFASFKGQLLNHGSVWHFGEVTRNLKGTARTLDGADGEIPLEDGLMSMEGFAVLDDSGTMGMDEEGNLTPPDGKGIDCYLFAYGWKFKDALKDYFHLSGNIPAVPRYALGNWWSRYYCYTEETYKALMNRFAKEQVPLSVAVLDMNWHITDIDPKYGAGWTGYSWNPEMFPDPPAMLSWLHDRNLKVTLNDHPADGIRACEDLYPQMAREMGIDPSTKAPVIFDAADPEFLKAWEKVILDTFEETGVDFWWIDWQQRGGSSIPGVDPLFVLNHTRWMYANRKGEVGITFSRYGGPGSHRYPVGFSGDSCITWDSLKFQPYFTATAANIGYGWWSHDIGGHMKGIRDEELSVRWLQFGIFSPIMRLHSTMSEFLSKEPWSYSERVCGIMEDYMRLRHRLLPWLYTQACKAAREGSVLLYPVYYDWELGWDLQRVERNEYVFGEDMLVAPIVTPVNPDTHLASADVWLPEGEWADFFTGRKYQGGHEMKVFRKLNEMPVFVKSGSIIPMDGSEILENGCPLPGCIRFRIFAGADGSYTLLEDNGCRPGSPDYRKCETTCRLMDREESDTLQIILDNAAGDTELLPAGRKMEIEIVGIGETAPDDVSCGFRYEYDSETRTMRICLDAEAGQAVSLKWSHYPTCPDTPVEKRIFDLLLPIRMSNLDKDRMLEIARTVKDPVQRMAAWMALPLPEGLPEALAEMEASR